MSNPKITISADVSSAQAEIQKLKDTVAELNASLAAGSSSKNQYTFQGSKKELDSLLKSAEKLLSVLDSGDKKSKQYAASLKSAASALSDAGKTAARLETAGDSIDQHTSGYFRTASSEINSEHSALAIQRQREQTQGRLDQEEQSRRDRVTKRMMGMVGAVGGSLANGGGGYSQLLSNAGGLLPGPLGFAAGMVGGFAGGMIDKNMDGAKKEMRSYSELTRMIGDTSASFLGLQDAVRFSVSAFAVSNVAAAEMAKNFVKLTGVTDKDAIAKAVGSAASLGQQFGIENSKAADFLGNTTLSGITKSQNDTNRVMIQLAETARRGGVSSQMESFMENISGMISRSAGNTFTSQSVGGYADVLASGSSLPYAGLNHNVSGVAGLINQASQFNSSNGGGEAVQEQRIRALNDALPGLGKWQPALRAFGIYDDLSKGFDEKSAIYGAAKTDSERQEVLSVRDQVRGQRLVDIYGNRSDKLGGNDIALRLGISGAMNGINPEQAAALDKIRHQKGGFGALEGKLDSFGIDKDQQAKYISRYAELAGGGPEAAKRYYEKLKAEKTLSPDLQKEGDKLAGKDLEKFVYKNVVPTQLDDQSLQAQKAQVQIESEIQKNLASLIGIETASKEALLGLLKIAFGDSPIVAKYENQKRTDPNIISDTDVNYQNVDTKALEETVKQIRAAKTLPEKKRIGDAAIQQFYDANMAGMPSNTKAIVENAMYDKGDSSSTASSDNAPSTIDAGPNYPGGLTKSQAAQVRLANSKTRFDDIIRRAEVANGIPEDALKLTFARESSFNPNARNEKAYGLGQVIKSNWSSLGLNDRNWNDPETNINASAKLFGQNYKRYGTLEKAFSHYNGSGPAAESYGRVSMAEYNSMHDQLPEGHNKTAERDQNVNVHVSGQFDLNQNGQRVARSAPIFTTSRGRPVPTGV